MSPETVQNIMGSSQKQTVYPTKTSGMWWDPCVSLFCAAQGPLSLPANGPFWSKNKHTCGFLGQGKYIQQANASSLSPAIQVLQKFSATCWFFGLALSLALQNSKGRPWPLVALSHLYWDVVNNWVGPRAALAVWFALRD